jgi:hypothetical protein
MSKRIVLLPGALPGGAWQGSLEEVLESSGELLFRCKLSRAAESRPGGPAEWLGLDPNRHQAAEGPLFVAALGAEPPIRTVAFRLSVLSTDGARVATPNYSPGPEEARELLALARRLETSRLRLVEGRALEHGLAWEDGSLDLRCRTPAEASEAGLRASLPEGDGESALRRFVDDSINLLAEWEGNRRREEEGLMPLNLLWPWAPGRMPEPPNLALERGRALRVESPSLLLAGWCRLVRYRHGDPFAVGTGTNLRLEEVCASLLASSDGLAVVPTIGEFWEAGKPHEAQWLWKEAMVRLLEPLAEEAQKGQSELSIFASDSSGCGFWAAYRPSPARKVAWASAAELLESLPQPRLRLFERLAREFAS